MKKVKLTKTELKKLQDELKRYDRYLPTLQIKKQLLQVEVSRVGKEIQRLDEDRQRIERGMDKWAALMGEEQGLADLLEPGELVSRSDNIAGVDLPVFVELTVRIKPYDLFSTPLWLDRALADLTQLMNLQAEKMVVQQQYRLLEVELRLTAQRVNLFEKVKIPQIIEQVRTITVYLADQQAAAAGWARIAKKKIKEAGR
ncbi:MAG TPA: V-type ATP synthase subunit D [Desulfobacterales bacterium]|nr:V-type ATP synthase subunit D [Desulfobacterales bacterium]